MSTPIQYLMLGSGAVRNNPQRNGPSQILMVGETPLMFDCGRSACTALARAGIRAEDINHLFFTHLHFDHIVDTAYLVFVGWNNSREQDLKIYGPPGTENFIRRLIRPPFEDDIASRLGHGKSEFGLDPLVQEIQPPAQVCETETYQIEAIAIPHADMVALAYSITCDDKRIVICGDGKPTPQLVEFCRDADLVAIECSGTKKFLATVPWGSWHATPETLGDFAREARIKTLVLKHFVIEDITGDRNAAEAMAQTIRGRCEAQVIAAQDGMTLSLN